MSPVNGNGSICKYHVDHANRIERLEGGMSDVIKNQRNPVVMVAIIGLFGTVFSGTMAFAAVIFAPIIRAYLGV